MLHIILLILKIIGIILLVLLGIFLALVLCLLFVPLRYKGQGSYYEKPEGSIKITWLLHVLSVAVTYKEQLQISVKLLGFRILKDFDEEPFEEAEEATKEAVRGAGKVAAREAGIPVSETAQERREPLPEFVKDDLAELNFDDEPMLSVQEVNRPVTAPKPEDIKSRERERPGTSEKKHEKSADYMGEKGLLRLVWRKIKSFFHRMAKGIKNIFTHLDRIRDARQDIMAFIADEKNKETFHLIVRQLKRMLRHLMPGKLKGHLSFGLSDPYMMGQVLSGAALFYPLYQKQFSLTPVFDRQFIEGELAFRGRIRFSLFLMAGLKILVNKNFRTQLKKFRNRGGM